MNILSDVMRFVAFAAVACCLLLTSCDKNASHEAFDSMEGTFKDNFAVALYVPDREVETDSLCEDSMLCITEVEDEVVLYADNDYSMRLCVNGLDSLCFELPFLNADGTVRGIFSKGVFAHLYNALKQAVEDNPTNIVLANKFDAFKNEIATIKDTLYLGSIMTDYVKCEVYGASLMSWDYEQKSYYVHFNAYDSSSKGGNNLIKYSRSCNIYRALSGIQDILQQWKSEGKLSPEVEKQLLDIANHKEGTTASWGWMRLAYSNQHLAFEMHIEPEYTRKAGAAADGMLDMLSIALFGKDANGLPNKAIWLIIGFDGSRLSQGLIPVD